MVEMYNVISLQSCKRQIFDRYLCKPRCKRDNKNTGAYFESEFAENRPGFNLFACYSE